MKCDELKASFSSCSIGDLRFHWNELNLEEPMTRAISVEQCTKAIVLGVQDAQRNYERWSGDWLWQGPEYLISSHVASRLAILPGACYVTLESGVRNTLKEAGAAHRGHPIKALRSNGRFDVVLWWASGVPRAAIEVKNGVWAFAQIEHDVDRIAAAVSKKLNTESKLQFGAVAFYASTRDNKRSDASKQLKSLNDTLLRKTKQAVGNTSKTISVCSVPSRIYKDKDSAWTAMCYVFN